MLTTCFDRRHRPTPSLLVDTTYPTVPAMRTPTENNLPSGVGRFSLAVIFIILSLSGPCFGQSVVPAQLRTCTSVSGEPQACIPATFNPVASSSNNLTATSTCGPGERYCSPDLLSMNPVSGNASGCSVCRSESEWRIDFVRSHTGLFQRWQSETTVSAVQTRVDVTVELPAERANMIVFSTTLVFPLEKPRDMAIEGVSADGSVTRWIYFSRDCATTTFSTPGIPCRDFNLSVPTETFVRTTVEDLNVSLSGEAERAAFVGQYGGLRGVRLAFLQMHLQDPLQPSQFYSLALWSVEAMCDCNGHAGTCSDDGRCACQHNTAEPGCDRCVPYDQPYMAATYVNQSANVCHTGKMQRSRESETPELLCM